VLLALGAWPAASVLAQRDTPCRDREPAAAQVEIAGPEEPGERLVITGRVLQGPEREPAPGARVLAFHTDARGYYSEGGISATGGPPAHVHFEVTIPGEAMHRLTLNFEGDPRLDGRRAGERWDDVRPVGAAAGGTQRVERDLWLR
jgi:protocatechuate 3,4-dioxygenase beta subunit